ncbi:MAG: LysM peptidoglycan-binding domain-containing protein [Anaerolineae bacterium]
MCGALLNGHKRPGLPLSQGSLNWILLIVVGAAIVWWWKSWQAGEPQALGLAPATATVRPSPTVTYPVAPTATPLHSPTPSPTTTLPPNQTRHVVESGETVSTIAKRYSTTTRAILQANNLKENTILKVGQELIIPLPVANTPTPTPTLIPSPTPYLYTIKWGDTLSAIAKRFNTTVEALMEANGIEDATRIQIGAQILIVQPPDFSATMAYETYEVQQGDTLFTIAAKFKLSVAEIKQINELKSDRLSVGHKLRIPLGTATPTPTFTPTPTLTPTPSPPWPAPVLLGPPDGAAFEGARTVILLNWASVGILKPDEWYVIRMRRSGTVAEQLPPVWTKATSWRVPQELYVAGLQEPQRFYWQVWIMRQSGVAGDGTWIGEPLSPTGQIRSFSWK